MSPNLAKSHEQCRALICLICRLKRDHVSVISSNPTSIVLKRVRIIFPGFDHADLSLPKAICSSCRNVLPKVAANPQDKEKLLPQLGSFPGFEGSGESTTCTCWICNLVRNHNVGQVGNKVGNKKPTALPVGRPSQQPAEKPKKYCPICFQKIGPGIRHPKCSPAKKRANVAKLLDEKGQEIVAGDVLEAKAASIPSSSSIQLRTRGGGKLKTVPNPKKGKQSRAIANNRPITAEEMRQAGTAAGLSINQIEVMAASLRALKGRDFFEPELLKKLSELDKAMLDFYKVGTLEIDSSDNREKVNESGKVERPAFFTDNVPSLLQSILLKRGWDLDGDYFVKVFIDKGGKWLKVCMTVEKAWDPLASPQRKSRRSRSKYKDGPNASKFKYSGVKRIIPIAFIEDAKETYDNIEKILLVTGLNGIDYVPCFDMKMALIFLGLGTAASTYPCLYCKKSKNDFADKDSICSGGQLRSFNGIAEHAQEYREAAAEHNGSKKLSSKDYFSSEHSPLYDPTELDKDSPVVHSIPPMELHELIGLGNQVYEEVESRLKSLGCNLTLQRWLEPLGVEKSEYHGGTFNGHQIIQVLNSTNRLRMLMNGSNELIEIEGFLVAMDQLNAVREACFGQTLDPDYKDEIRLLADYWLECGLSVTPKAHVLFVHVAHFLDHHNEGSTNTKGLGYWSEQTGEAVHSDFEKLWVGSAYKRKRGHPDYERLALKCLVTYASRHVVET